MDKIAPALMIVAAILFLATLIRAVTPKLELIAIGLAGMAASFVLT